MRATFQESVKELVDAPIYGILLKMIYYKLVMKYVERRKIGGTTRIRDDGMKR